MPDSSTFRVVTFIPCFLFLMLRALLSRLCTLLHRQYRTPPYRHQQHEHRCRFHRRCERTIRSVSLHGALAPSAPQLEACTAAREMVAGAEGTSEALYPPLMTLIRQRG